MIELYHGGPAGHSAAVLIGLAEKGLDYEERAIDLAAFEQHGDDFLTVNPAGQVPVLRADGHTLTESFFILLYLDERHPEPPLGGADGRARYGVQKWGKYVETHIAPNLAIVAWALGGREPSEAVRAGFERLPDERRALWTKAAGAFGGEEIESARAALAKAVARVAEDLAAAPWLTGKSFGIADIAVYPHLARFGALGIEVPQSVSDWIARVEARPGVRKALPDGVRNIATMGPERGRWG